MSVELTKEVWNEEGMSQLLGCKRSQLRGLSAQHGLPRRRLQKGLYVYLADEVLRWLNERPVIGGEEEEGEANGGHEARRQQEQEGGQQ